MLIINQDRDTTIDFDNAIKIEIRKYCDNFYMTCGLANGTYEYLGTYKTYERAKEVFQEMFAKYITVKRGTRIVLPIYKMPEE